MAILTGAADAVYPSLADRLAAVGRVDATKRPRTSGDCGPLERLLTAAGLERRRDGGER